MQKKLIALAIAGLSGAAFAQSNVSLYGIVDAAVVNTSLSGKSGGTTVVAGGLSASRLGFNASEDLGGGTKALVNLEYALDTQNNGGIGFANAPLNSGVVARQQLLGLTGNWGTFATGFLQTAANDFGAKYDVTAGSAVSPLQNITKGNKFLVGSAATDPRAGSALAYISPNMNGFKVALNYAYLTQLYVAGAEGTAKPTATLLASSYDHGPLSLNLTFARNNMDTNVPGGITNEWAAGASYDFGVLTLKGTYQSKHTDANGTAGNKDKAWSLGAVIPAGPGAAALTYAKSSLGTVSNADAKGYTAAYLYTLSKRTTAYVAYNHMSQDSATNVITVDNSAFAGGTLNAGSSSSLFAVGMRHSF